jgi:hypothetical protein
VPRRFLDAGRLRMRKVSVLPASKNLHKLHKLHKLARSGLAWETAGHGAPTRSAYGRFLAFFARTRLIGKGSNSDGGRSRPSQMGREHALRERRLAGTLATREATPSSELDLLRQAQRIVDLDPEIPDRPGAPWVIRTADLIGFTDRKRSDRPLTPNPDQRAFDFQ